AEEDQGVVGSLGIRGNRIMIDEFAVLGDSYLLDQVEVQHIRIPGLHVLVPQPHPREIARGSLWRYQSWIPSSRFPSSPPHFISQHMVYGAPIELGSPPGTRHEAMIRSKNQSAAT